MELVYWSEVGDLGRSSIISDNDIDNDNDNTIDD